MNKYVILGILGVGLHLAPHAHAQPISLVEAMQKTSAYAVPGSVGCSWTVNIHAKVANLGSTKSIHAIYQPSGTTIWKGVELQFVKTLQDQHELWGGRVSDNCYQPNQFDKFALKYNVNGQEYWDNNGGTNYHLDRVSVSPSYPDATTMVGITYLSGTQFQSPGQYSLACGTDKMWIRDMDYWRNGPGEMTCDTDTGLWTIENFTGSRFMFSLGGNTEGEGFWSSWVFIGDLNKDGLADNGENDVINVNNNAPKKITYNYVSKEYKVEYAQDLRRTVVYLYGQTISGQDMFIRGGVDWDYAKAKLGRNCFVDKWLCAVPIQHNGKFATQYQRVNDKHLDWYGAEPNQGNVEGSPLVWTTNAWPASWGPKKTVAADGYGEDTENRWGAHYWKLDVTMDCSKSVNGWFELKAYISNGPGWESNITQTGAPYASNNHFARCGYLNVFRRGENNPVTIEPLP